MDLQRTTAPLQDSCHSAGRLPTTVTEKGASPRVMLKIVIFGYLSNIYS
jgi:hypothetical protein